MGKKYIDHGVQYFVYDLGNGKVLKRKTSFYDKIKIFRHWWKDEKLTKLIRYSFNTTNDTKLSKKFILNNPQISNLCGNPQYINKFFRKYDYIQDKAIPLKDYLKHHNIDENKKILKKYILFVLENWRWGFSSKVFNFDRNFGVNNKGDVIIIDFGELFFETDGIIREIKEKYWLKKESYKDLNSQLKKYFEEEMDKYITLENLEKYWNKNRK